MPRCAGGMGLRRRLYVCGCACVRVCVWVCGSVCVCACVWVRVRVRVSVRVGVCLPVSMCPPVRAGVCEPERPSFDAALACPVDCGRIDWDPQNPNTRTPGRYDFVNCVTTTYGNNPNCPACAAGYDSHPSPPTATCGPRQPTSGPGRWVYAGGCRPSMPLREGWRTGGGAQGWGRGGGGQGEGGGVVGGCRGARGGGGRAGGGEGRGGGVWGGGGDSGAGVAQEWGKGRGARGGGGLAHSLSGQFSRRRPACPFGYKAPQGQGAAPRPAGRDAQAPAHRHTQCQATVQSVDRRTCAGGTPPAAGEGGRWAVGQSAPPVICLDFG